MSATFVTDIATVAGLTILFAKPTLWIIPFVLASVALIGGLPKLAPWFFGRYEDRWATPSSPVAAMRECPRAQAGYAPVSPTLSATKRGGEDESSASVLSQSDSSLRRT